MSQISHTMSKGDKQRLINYSCFHQLLRNPALPKEQVLSWTQEREERQNREGRRRGAAALVDPQSPEIVTAWNHRVRDKPLTQQTHPKTLMHTFFFFSSSFVQKRGQARTHVAAVHYSSWVQGGYVCLEHLYPSLAPSLRDYIMSHTTSTQFLSVTFALHLGTHHTTRCLPARILCKTTCAAWKEGLKYEFCVQCACDRGSVCWGFICAQELSSPEHWRDRR